MELNLLLVEYGYYHDSIVQEAVYVLEKDSPDCSCLGSKGVFLRGFRRRKERTSMAPNYCA